MLDKRKKFSHDTDTDVLEHSTFRPAKREEYKENDVCNDQRNS